MVKKMLLVWFGLVLAAGECFGMTVQESGYTPGVPFGRRARSLMFQIALSPDESTLYASYWTSDSPEPVLAYSTSDWSHEVVFTYGTCHGGVALSPDGRYVYATTYYQGGIARYDTQTGQVVHLGLGSWGVILSGTSDGNSLLATYNEWSSAPTCHASLALVNVAGGAFAVVSRLPLGGPSQLYARGPVTYSADGRRVYLVTGLSDTSNPRVLEISFDGALALERSLVLPFADPPTNVVRVGDRLYVGSTVQPALIEIDLATFLPTGREFALDQAPFTLGVHPDDRHIFVLHDAGALSVIDAATGERECYVTDLHPVTDLPPRPVDIEFTADGSRAFVLQMDPSGETGGIVDLDVLVNQQPAELVGRLAFREGSSGGIHIMDLPGGTPVPLPVPVPSYGCQWSSDGHWLAFEGGTLGANDIYVARPDGSGFRNLTSSGPHWVFSPSFSPDGQQIVFNKGYGPIYTINFDGSGLVQVPLTVGGCQPRWSPVDNRVVYSDWAAGGGYHSDIFVYDLDTGSTTQITHHAAAGAEYFYGPSWSCDGTQIVMAGARTGQDYRDIWVVDADGSSPPMNLTAVWGDNSDETEPAWSPDGQYIVFSSNRAGDYDIWAMRPDGSELQKVYGAPGVEETQPAITVIPVNDPPVANAGGPYSARATSWHGAVVSLDGTGSSDPDGDGLTYSWAVGDTTIGTGSTLEWEFPVGDTQVTLTVRDPSGATATDVTTVTVLVTEAETDLKPDTLNLRSRGRYVTTYIELPEGYDVADIDVGSVCLTVDDNETVVLAEPRPVAIGDYDNDGVPDLMVKFDRQAVQALLTPGETVTVYVGGVLTDGTEFLSSDTLRVLVPAVNSSMLTFLGQVAQANEAACGAGQALFDSLTSSRRGRGTSGQARRVLRLLDALLRRSPEPGLSTALGQVWDALSDSAQQGVGPSEKIDLSDVQLYSQARYVANCFAVLGDCYDFERGAWLRIRRGLSTDFDLTEAYEALDVVEAQIALLSEVIDDFRALAGAVGDPERAQQLTALADDVQALLLSLEEYAVAEGAYVDSW